MPYGFIAIDVGNTRMKATLLSDSPEKTIAESFASDDVEGLIGFVEALTRRGPLCGALAATGHVDARLAESLRQLLEEKFLVITPATELPIATTYLTPQTLGLDRKATACAAIGLFPGKSSIVVDAGTALTIDIIDDKGVFKGGNISPGMQMRFRALHEFTSKLPLISPDDNEQVPSFGADTRSAIIAGVVGGWVDETCASISRAASEGVAQVLLTGGDAPRLIATLKKYFADRGAKCLPTAEIRIDYFPHLLAEGMRTIYKHHENLQI